MIDVIQIIVWDLCVCKTFELQLISTYFASNQQNFLIL